MTKSLRRLGAIGNNAQTHSIATSLISAFTPNMVNEFRAGVNRTDAVFSVAASVRSIRWA